MRTSCQAVFLDTAQVYKCHGMCKGSFKECADRNFLLLAKVACTDLDIHTICTMDLINFTEWNVVVIRLVTACVKTHRNINRSLKTRTYLSFVDSFQDMQRI